MFNKLYMKITAYFLMIIATTLVAVSLLFFFTMGRPMARDVHTMLRNHTRYLENLVRDSAGNGEHMLASLERFSAHYGFGLALFNERRHLVFSSTSLKNENIALHDSMFERMSRDGIFVQSGHFGRPVIYMLPVDLNGKSRVYLYITKHFPENRALTSFFMGLVFIGGLLALAVYPLSKGITRPLIQLTRSLTDISHGEFSDMPETRRTDEIGDLLRVFREMSQSVDRMIHSKKQLLADISHELCSPLARIRVGTELIRDMSRDDKTLRYLEKIENDIVFMDHLILNLSVYSQMNLPGFVLKRCGLEAGELVLHIAGQYQLITARQSITIEQNLSRNLPRVTGDFERLKQVYSNVLDNAIRYTDRGGCIVIGAETGMGNVSFFVEDQGPGVPEDERGKIFDPLYRVDSSRNRDSGGAGLGLAISRKIMELHGGTLTYSRQQGRTRFTFTVPIEPDGI